MDTDKIMSFLTQAAVGYGLKIAGAIIILLAGSIVIKAIKGAVEKALDAKDVDETLKKFAVSGTSILLWVFVIVAVLAKFGIEVAPIIAGLGIAGFTIGFALQGSLSNFAAGVMLIIMRPFKVGDVVDVAGSIGAVREIGLLACTLATPDNQKIMIPNGVIFGGKITNITAYDTRRVDFTVGIGYGDSIDQAKKVCLDVVNAHPLVLKDPAPMIAVSELADSSVNFTLRVWAKTSDYWSVYFDCTETLKKKLDEAGIEIPFPQQNVWMNQLESN